MNGGQDLGGMMGFGAVEPNPPGEDPVFHADWERSAFAVTLAAGALGQWSIDESRHARESLPPGEYLTSSYYQIWLKGLERLLLDHRMVSGEELASGHMRFPPLPVSPLKAADVAPALARGAPYQRPAESAPRYRVGECVRTLNIHPTGHTRLPRYARGKAGVIDRCHGAFVFADASAARRGESPQWLYTVRFTGAELWGEEANSDLCVSVDAWESYLVGA